MNSKAGQREFILGGQRSGKSRRAEHLAQQWLAQSPQHSAVLIATAQAFDAEMQARIARHRQDRAVRVPSMRTVEEPLHLAQTITDHSRPETLVLVDCLTLWLSAWLMPAVPVVGVERPQAPIADLLQAITEARGPLLLVSNEIGLGVIPMGAAVREFVDVLGQLNQAVATRCERVSLMAAGLPLYLKGTP